MARWRTPVVPLLLLLLLTPSQQGDAAAASGIVNQVLPRMSAAPTVTVQAAVDKVRPTLGEEPPAAVPGSGDPRQVAAALSAARNEFEAVQVVVTGPATGVSAASVPLAGPGPDIPLRLSRAVSVSLDHASGPDGAAGEWFDALVPSQDEFYNESRNAFPFAVSAGERGLIWCEVFVPPQQPPGKYTGSVVVTWGGSGAHNTRAGSAAVAMALEVQPFTLPSVATLKSEFGFSFADITKGHGIKYGPQLSDLREKYAVFALDHRVSLASVDDGNLLNDYDTVFNQSIGGTRTPLAPATCPQLVGARLTNLACPDGR
jgi:hypothetical protein